MGDKALYNSTTFLWITDFLTDRTQQVLLEGHKSSTASVFSGVPHGTMLGPLLFLLYINDLAERTTSDARLFADDCLLYRSVTVKTESDILQRDLDALISWEEDVLPDGISPGEVCIIT